MARSVRRPKQQSRDKPGSPVPAPFLERMARLLGEEYSAFLESYDEPPCAGLRVNTLKVAPEAFQDLAPFALTSLPWPPAAYLISDGSLVPQGRNAGQPGKHPYYAAGLYYLQDPSAMAAAELLSPQPGERVLDLAAAPGGKATQLASLLGQDGLLVANEIHPRRAWDLAQNLERWGARNASITCESPERLAAAFPAFFDRVLVDAPCSGEGMFRKSEAARLEWGPALVSGCAARQDAILGDAAHMVRPGGRLAYATCTFAPEEDEGTLARFLRSHPDFHLLPLPAHAGFAPGRPDWLPGAEIAPELARAIRLWPHVYPGEGHFVAVLRRMPEPNSDPPPGGPRPAARDPRSERRGRHGARPCEPLPRPLQALYAAFCTGHLSAEPAAERLVLAGSYLYQLPPGLPSLDGLNVVHPGWWLGTFSKNRFAPSHALALALAPRQARRTLDLAPEGAEVAAYLRGEALRSPGEEGWVLVTVSGFPLGWAWRAGSLAKSHYPRGLRRLA
jgi:16S rRNA C967 or C1407 C5-methylase (RsmB/RsmF family)/NOL1/NOP2/fmu family ribosome biogenesis protein